MFTVVFFSCPADTFKRITATFRWNTVKPLTRIALLVCFHRNPRKTASKEGLNLRLNVIFLYLVIVLENMKRFSIKEMESQHYIILSVLL